MNTIMIMILVVLFVSVFAVTTTIYTTFRSWKTVETDLADSSIIATDVSKTEFWEEAGLKIAKKSWYLYTVVIAVILGICFAIGTKNTLIGFSAFTGTVVLSFIYTSGRIKKRRGEFSNQLSEALPQIAENMKSGMSLEKSFRTVTGAFPSPLSSEFATAYSELNYGATFASAVNSMTRRVKNKDLSLLSVAIFIQQDTGGNLAETLETISNTINERIQIKRDIKSKTSAIKVSVIIITILPWLLLAIMVLLNKEVYGSFFSSTTGTICLVFVVILEAIGATVINKMSNMEME